MATETQVQPTTPLAAASSPTVGTSLSTTDMTVYVPTTPLRGGTFLSDLEIRGVASDSILLFKRTLSNIIPAENPTTILILSKSNATLQWQTNKFILQQISKPLQERFQLVETFDDPALFFFGEKARVYTIQGVLLDSDFGTGADKTDKEKKVKNRNHWAQGMQDFYERHLRGTKLLEEGNIAALYLNNWYIKGYPFAFSMSKESTSMPDGVSFQMSWVVTDDTLMRATKQSNIDYLYKGLQLNAELAQLFNQLNAKLQDWSIYNNKLVNATYATQAEMQKDIDARDKLANELQTQKAELSDKVARYNASAQQQNPEDGLNYL